MVSRSIAAVFTLAEHPFFIGLPLHTPGIQAKQSSLGMRR